MKAVLWLINKYFWKSYVGPISIIALPLLFMSLYAAISKNSFINGMPLFLVVSILPISLIVIPQLLVDLKKSLLLNRIGSSNIKKWHFFLIVMAFTFIILISSIILIFINYTWIGLAAGINLNKLYQNNSLSWFSLFYSIIILYLISGIIGITTGLLIKSSLASSAIGFSTILISLFMSGMFAPIQFIRSVEAIKYISYFNPLSGPLLNITESWGTIGIDLTLSNGNIWDFSGEWIYTNIKKPDEHPIVLINSVNHIMNILLPYFFIIIFSLVSFKKFTWGAR